MSITSYPVLAGSTETSLAAPWYMQVARNKVANCTAVNIFASSSNVGTGTPATLWELTGTTAYAFPTTAQQMHVVSTSATDNSGSSLVISGLDANWNLVTEVVAMMGTTVITTVNSFLRINSIAFVPTAGQVANVGTITVKNLANSITYAQLNPTYGRTAMSIYSVPAGHTLYVTNINAFSGDGNGGSAYILYRARAINNAPVVPITVTALDTTFAGVYSIMRVTPFPYLEKTDIQWQFATNTGTHSVALNLEAVLISNTAP